MLFPPCWPSYLIFFFFFSWMDFCDNHWEIKNKSPLSLLGLGRIILNSAEQGRKREGFCFLFVLDLPLVYGNPAWFQTYSLGAELKVAIIKCNFPSTAKVHRFPGSQLLVTFSVYLWLNMNINEPSVLLTLPFPNLFTTILSFRDERRKKNKKGKT